MRQPSSDNAVAWATYSCRLPEGLTPPQEPHQALLLYQGPVGHGHQLATARLLAAPLAPADPIALPRTSPKQASEGSGHFRIPCDRPPNRRAVRHSRPALERIAEGMLSTPVACCMLALQVVGTQRGPLVRRFAFSPFTPASAEIPTPDTR